MGLPREPGCGFQGLHVRFVGWGPKADNMRDLLVHAGALVHQPKQSARRGGVGRGGRGGGEGDEEEECDLLVTGELDL